MFLNPLIFASAISPWKAVVKYRLSIYLFIIVFCDSCVCFGRGVHFKKEYRFGIIQNIFA